MPPRAAFTFWVLAAALGLSTAAAAAEEIPRSADYEAAFEVLWSEETHPGAFPPGAEIGLLTGGTHVEEGGFWHEGEVASLGVRHLAELAGNNALFEEVRSARRAGDADALLILEADSAPLQFTALRKHPLLSLAGGISPSPDWFTGAEGVRLLGAEGWEERIVLDLHAYDAGTDSGDDFDSPDSPTVPPEPIQKIAEGPLAAQPLARLTITLLRAPGAEPLFRRGDANSDGWVDIADPVFILRYLFVGDAAIECLDAADVQDVGIVAIDEAVVLLQHLFLGGPPGAPPFHHCGIDSNPTDDLGCETPPPCE